MNPYQEVIDKAKELGRRSTQVLTDLKDLFDWLNKKSRAHEAAQQAGAADACICPRFMSGEKVIEADKCSGCK